MNPNEPQSNPQPPAPAPAAPQPPVPTPAPAPAAPTPPQPAPAPQPPIGQNPDPSLIPPSQPPAPTGLPPVGTPAGPVAGGNLGFDPQDTKSFKKKTMMVIAGVVAFMILGVIGFFGLSMLSGGDYSNMEKHEYENFSVEIPSGWTVEENTSDWQFYDGPSVDEAPAIVVITTDSIPGYESLTAAEKDELVQQLIEFLKDPANTPSEDFSEFKIENLESFEHPSADRGAKGTFVAKSTNGDEVKGEIYFMVTPSGDVYAIVTGALTDVWNKNEDNFHHIIESFTTN